ncbi:DUF1214 domain-containing protein [Sediminitomix flava]|uniref:Uncharacterized protein DUF1214 n=1 Tax=Sediminitomix flava TaxID=379075 RepID=A0A315Z7U3_SEDFL|nr:DUF1214 domain-containing protein [Sediminitomix flava]PWJ41001.1 uncharacterized protein DUF1214 [Sediminitomix flava]
MKRLLTVTYSILTVILLQEVLAEDDLKNETTYKYPDKVKNVYEIVEEQIQTYNPPLRYTVDTTIIYGRNMKEEAIYLKVKPEANNGAVPHQLTLKDVPVDGFWSVGVYDEQGKMLRNSSGLYAYNNSSVDKNPDGSVTINFGNEEGTINNLSIKDGWICMIRLYKPRKELLMGAWQFPLPTPIDNSVMYSR